MGKYSKQKKHLSYIEQKINELGENFIDLLTPKQMRNDARRIFIDISRGNINYDLYWKYIAHPMMLNALIEMSENQRIMASTSYTGISWYTSQFGMNNSAQEQVLQYHRVCNEAYSNISSSLIKIRDDRNANVISELVSLTNRLYNLKGAFSPPALSIVGSDYNDQFDDSLLPGFNANKNINNEPSIDLVYDESAAMEKKDEPLAVLSFTAPIENQGPSYVKPTFTICKE